ncbi:MAG TPA: cupin domain-containing protein [Caulobacteraceae bacterium]|jgi:quercetin dioxygenase-like cupin family protein
MPKPFLLIAAAAAALSSAALAADAPPLPVRHVLQTAPSSASPNTQIVVTEVVFAKGAKLPFHTHPGEEALVIKSGSLVMELEGKPARNLKAGDSFVIPRGVAHQAASPDGETHVIATYVVDKDKPLVTMKKP